MNSFFRIAFDRMPNKYIVDSVARMELVRIVEDKFYATILNLPETEAETKVSIRNLAKEVILLIYERFSKSSQLDHNDLPGFQESDPRSFSTLDDD